MKLRQLEILHAILQTGSITKAASLLSITQPTVSSVLQHSEAQLGIQLFERSGGRLKPSPEALALLPEIREIFKRVERVSENAKSLAQGRLGRIAVAGTLALANGYLVEAVTQFQKSFPNVEVTIHSLQTPDIIERVIAREFDLGVCYGPIDNPAVDVELLAVRDLVCVLPENHPLATKEIIQVSDLANETVVSYVDGDKLRQKVDKIMGGVESRPEFKIQVSQTITAIRLVSSGAGIAVVEPFFFAAMKPAGLVAKPISPSATLSVEAVTPSGMVQSVVMVEFMRTLRMVTSGA